MAFASVGTLGSALSSGNNQTTLAITTSAAAEAGNFVVMIIAVDNNQTTDGASTAVSGVVDSTGANTWARAIGFANGNGTNQTGADISIWYSKIASTIALGGTITASFTTQSTSDASAMSAWEYTIGAGSTVSIEGTPGGLANDAAAAGSLDVTTANIECLRVRAIASESNSTTALTATSGSWTILTQAVSGAGTSATEMGVRGEFIISTGTSDASAPTNGAGAVDNASAYVAFKEIVVQALTPDLFAEGDTFYGPTIGVGEVNLDPSLFTESDTFYAATVGAGPVNLDPSLVTNTATFYAATVAAAGEDQALVAGLYTDDDTFYAPAVTSVIDLSASLVTNSSVFYAATVAGDGSVSARRLTLMLVG